MRPAFRLAFLLLVAIGLGGNVQAAPNVRVNELMSANDAVLADEEGDFSDWIELINVGTEPVPLLGYGLTDDPRHPFKWRFEGRQELAPGNFLVVFASGKDRQPTPADPLDPAAVPGLRLSYAADSINAGDAQQVRVAGGSRFVQQWLNRVPGGSPARQSDPSAQPRLIPNAVNGRAALHFDGLNDVLRWSQPPGTNDFTLISVVRASGGHEIDPESTAGVGGVSGQHWLFGATHGGDLDGGAGVSLGTNGVSVYEHGSGYLPALAVTSGTVGSGWVVVSVTYENRRPQIALQGVAVRTGLTSPRRQVWAPTDLGAGAYGALEGEVAEVLAFDRALTTTERRGIEQFLAGRYSLVFSQPVHTSFQLGASGESVQLTAPDGTVMDRVDFGALPRDVSYGRQPDGTGPWKLFAQPTPGQSNTTPGANELLQPVQFLTPGGFYSNSVTVTLAVTNPGAIIHYTTDGSEPGVTSATYTSPLTLGSRAGTAAVLAQIPTAGGWQPPAGAVFQGWVLRANAFKAGALSAGVTTHSYFITPRGRTRYSVPVVSLTTERANLFDPAIGLYVPGNTGANFSQRGTEWERPAFVEVFETNGLRVVAQAAQLSIHGNTSQGFPIKGLDLDAAGSPERRPFAYPFFPDRARTKFNNVLLRPSGQDSYLAFQRDEFMQNLMHDTGAESQASRLAVVFLNGEYWGLHYLKEKEDDQFIQHYSGLAPRGFDYLEGYAAPKAGDTAAWDSLLQLLTTHRPADPDTYAEVLRRMDVPNYIDFKAAEIFTYRWDIGNHRFWRPRAPDGRFRWLQYDNDVGWGGFWSVAPAWDFDMLQADLETSGSLHGHNNETTTFLLRKLSENPDFQRAFINRFADLLNTVYQPANTLARIQRFSQALEPEMTEHTLRWRAPGSLSEWRGQVQYLRDFAGRRPAAIRRHLRQKFKLGADVTVRAAVESPGQGVLRLNTVPITAPPANPWIGQYFLDHPLDVAAEPARGYRFVRWDGLFGITTNRLTLRPGGDFSLTAVFAPVPVRLTARATAAGVLLEFTGSPATNYRLEQSQDLTTWSLEREVTTDAQGQGQVTNAFTARGAWFRLKLPTDPPS